MKKLLLALVVALTLIGVAKAEMDGPFDLELKDVAYQTMYWAQNNWYTVEYQVVPAHDQALQSVQQNPAYNAMLATPTPTELVDTKDSWDTACNAIAAGELARSIAWSEYQLGVADFVEGEDNYQAHFDYWPYGHYNYGNPPFDPGGYDCPAGSESLCGDYSNNLWVHCCTGHFNPAVMTHMQAAATIYQANTILLTQINTDLMTWWYEHGV